MINILIPTDDGLAIAPDFDQASSLRLLTVSNGIIKNDTIRAASQVDRLISTNPVFQNRNPLDRPVIIARGISEETEESFRSDNCEVLHTRETNIVNALMSYLKNAAAAESNYCCCP